MKLSKLCLSFRKLIDICFLYFGCHLSNSGLFSTKRFLSVNSFAWNACMHLSYKFRSITIKSVASSAMIVAFRTQSEFIKASSPKLLPDSANRTLLSWYYEKTTYTTGWIIANLSQIWKPSIELYWIKLVLLLNSAIICTHVWHNILANEK